MLWHSSHRQSTSTRSCAGLIDPHDPSRQETVFNKKKPDFNGHDIQEHVLISIVTFNMYCVVIIIMQNKNKKRLFIPGVA